MYHTYQNDYNQTVIVADGNVIIFSTFPSSGRLANVLAYLSQGEEYTLDFMLSYFGNWCVE